MVHACIAGQAAFVNHPSCMLAQQAQDQDQRQAFPFLSLPLGQMHSLEMNKAFVAREMQAGALNLLFTSI